MLELSKRWFVRYGLAVLAVGLALLITSSVDLIATSTPFALFFIAVAVTTWYGGRLPGFAALILSVIVCIYFIIPPHYGFVLHLPDVFKIGTFMAVSFFLVMVVAGMHKRERSIRASESRYRTLFEYAPDGIIIASPEGYYLDANAGMDRMLGYSPGELIGMQASDIVARAEMVHIGDALDEFKPETEYHREVEFRRKNGSVFVGDVTVTTMPNGNLIAVIRDGTDRIHSETTLRQSQKRLADAQRLAHIGSWEWDLRTNFLAWSDEHYRIFGLSPSNSDNDLSLEGIFSKCVHAEDVDDLNTAVERSRKTLRPFSLDFRVIHPDGSIHTIHSLGSVSADERGIAVSMHGTAQDVTEVKRAESLRGVISEILQGVVTTRNLDEFLKLVHRAISPVVYAENCFVMLHDSETDTVYFEFWVDKKDPQPRSKRRGTGFATYVLRTGLPLRLTSETKKKLHAQGEAEQIGSPSASWLGVPLRTPLRTIGVLVLQHYEDEHAYSERDLEFLSSVGDQIALAIDRKRAEDALSESNEKFHQLADNISEVFWITSPDFTTMHYVSAAYELIWGRSAESLYADPHQWIESIVPAEREYAFAQFAALTGTTKEISIEYRIDHPDGTVRWIHARGFQVKDVSGKLISITGIASDITDRKLAEAALEESEASFKSLFNTSNDAILVLNEGIFLACNPQAEILFGCGKQDLVGNSPAAFSPQEQPDGRLSSEKAFEYMEAAMMGVPQFFEWKHTRLDGTSFDAEVSLNRVDFGGATRLQGTVRDITERKRSEKMIELTLQRLNNAQRVGKIGDWDWDVASGSITWSHEVFEIVGRDPEDGPPITYEEQLSYYDISSRQLMDSKVTAAMESGEPQEYELVVVRPNGERVCVQAMCEPRKGADGNIIGLNGTIQDISARKLAEVALTASESRYHSLFENMLEGYAYCDTVFEGDQLQDFIYKEVNGAFETLTGLKNVVGKKVRDVIPGLAETNPELFAIYGRVVLTGKPEKFETYVEPLGIWLSITVYSSNRENFTTVFGNITEQKLANAALNESNEKFHQLTDNLTDAFWIRSPDMNKIYYISPAYEQIWGRTLEGNYAHPHAWYEFIVPEDRQNVKEAYKKLMGDSPKMEIEYRIIRPDGERRWVCSRGFQVRDATGEIIRLAGITTDITDKKHSDDELGESENRYRTLFEMSPDAVGMFDLDMNVLVANSRSAELFGYATVDEMNGKNAFDLIASENLDRSRDNIRRIFESGYLAPIESMGVRADGSQIAVEFSATLIRNSDGSPQAVLGVIRDIAERNLAEQKLRSSEENLAKSQEIAHLGSWDLIIPETGNVNEGRLRWSDEVYRIFGYAPKQIEVTNDTFFAAVHPDDRALVAAAMAKALAEGGHYRIDHRIIRPDGSERFVHEHSEIIRDKETGKPVKMVGTVQDITNQKQLGEQLRQSQKMEAVGVLAGGIAHDFNNLLTAINGYSDLTLRKMSPDDPLRLNIEEVRNAGTRAAELTSQLLTFSRKQVLRSAVINLNTVVSNIEKMLRRIIRESIELRAVLDPQLRNVRADPGQIEQVIMNLAINARDAMPTGGTLTIETENVFIDKEYVSQHVSVKPGNFVKMTVTDTGEGMTVQTLDHIFEPFFTTKVVGKGTGLGLSTVYGIITRSGGDINVQSEPGHGTTFKIYLPCVDEVVERPKWLDITDEKYLGTETILLVEDEAIVRRLVGEILKSNGYHILETADGEAALSLCRSYTKRIDMLLTDVIMPNMGGSELRDKVVELLPDIKVLFMSGYTDDSIVHREIFDSHIEFVEKPFTPDGLSRKVREVLES